jgi:hypothetical protein
MENYTQDELTDWINQKAKDLTAGTVQKRLLNSSRGENAIIGNLYFFKYDPKLKAKLEIYDKYPMAFPIKMYRDGFLGVNMHYLATGDRKEFVKKIIEYKRTSDDDKASVNAEFLSLMESSKKIYELMPQAVHRYLINHARSRFIKILPEEYEKAVQLKIDEWVIKG